mmetsp:Transcript_60766/g.163628  ORF Transcript_60766/g.163628 Transcript_60766/m.163628 type:complete len:208 (-) Transcript_60766:78-701(-)
MFHDDGWHRHTDASGREHGSERMDAHINVSSFAGADEGATLEEARQCCNGMPHPSRALIGGRSEQKRRLGDEHGAGNGAQDRAEVQQAESLVQEDAAQQCSKHNVDAHERSDVARRCANLHGDDAERPVGCPKGTFPDDPLDDPALRHRRPFRKDVGDDDATGERTARGRRVPVRPTRPHHELADDEIAGDDDATQHIQKDAGHCHR